MSKQDLSTLIASSSPSFQANFSLSDVVTVFVSDWEKKLKEVKKQVQADIQKVNGQIKKVKEEMVAYVTVKLEEVFSSVKVEEPLFVKLKLVKVEVKDGKINIQYLHTITLYKEVDGGNDYYGTDYVLDSHLKGEFGKLESLKEEMESLVGRMTKVDGELRDVNGKEREVKAILTRKQLEEKGVDLKSLTAASLGLTFGE